MTTNYNKVFPCLSTLRSKADAVRAAEEEYKANKRAIANSLITYLDSAPEGTIVLNRDLANAAGIDPSHMASIIRTSCDSRITISYEHIIKRYAEIDENGNIVPGGTIKEIRQRLCAYRKKNYRGW